MKHDELGHRKRLGAFLRDRRDSSGQPRADLWRQGLLDFVQLDVDASILWASIGPGPLYIESQVQWDNSPQPPTPDKSFQGAGPDSGEVTDIAIDPSGATDQRIFIATNDGGIWKSADSGITWSPMMDPMLSLSMGAVAIDPNNPQIIYAGSGNPFDGGRAFTKGVGIFRSSDGGRTWSIVDGGPFDTIFAGYFINRIVVTPDCLLVATNNGLFRSVDGGQNFGSNVLGGFVTCLLLDAKDSKIVYAGVNGVGVMKSVNGGATFPQNLFDNPGAPTAQPFGNMEIAQSESNPQTLLVSLQYSPPSNDPAVYRGLFQSTDGGEHWQQISDVSAAAADGFDQTWYDLTLGIDPQNASLVYAGFQELWLSADGGRTFQSQACTWGQVHWDHHALAFSPSGHRSAGSPTPIYIGTDGGISKSTDGGATWTAINGAIASNLLLGIGIGRGAGNAYTYGGCQDTGTSAHRPDDAGTTIWRLGIDGDGYAVAVDPSDPKIVYGFDDSAFIRSTDAGITFRTNNPDQLDSVALGRGLPLLSTIPTRAIALEQNGTDAATRVVYVALNQDLYKSSDAGESFGESILKTSANIITLATTTADSKLVWAGTADGSVHVSTDAGATWDKDPLPAQPGAGSVTGIAIDPTTSSRVAIVYSGQSGIDATYRTQRVFLTTNSGGAWYDISGTDGKGPVGNLPDLPMHSVVFDTSVTPPAIIVASDAGVMRSTDATVSGTVSGAGVTATWKIYGAGLPNVSCTSLAIDNTVTPPVLRVGTYGRGCFEATRPQGPALSIESDLGFGIVPEGQSGTLSVYVYNSGDGTLTVTGVARSAGSIDFAVSPTAVFPIIVSPGGTQAFDIVFTPSSLGDEAASFDIASNDSHSPHPLAASGTGVRAVAPRLATNPSAPASFGNVPQKTSRSILLQMFNTGTLDLNVSAVNVTGNPGFSVDPAPKFPIAVPPGGEADVTLKYQPAGLGYATATVEILSDDPRVRPPIQLNGTGV